MSSNFWLDKKLEKDNEEWREIPRNEISPCSACKQAQETIEQAQETILSLQTKLQSLQSEYEKTLSEGYEEAYKIIEDLRKKNSEMEVKLYSEYNQSLKTQREHMIDMVDKYIEESNKEFLKMSGKEVMAKAVPVENPQQLNLFETKPTIGRSQRK